MLSDRDIRAAIDTGEMTIDGLVDGSIGPASIDLHLGTELLVPRCGLDVDPTRRPDLDLMKQVDLPHVLAPGECALGATVETVGLAHGLAARFEGRSSLGRLFLAVHVTAGFIDPGFYGQITAELINHSPNWITLTSGMSIGQLCIIRLSSPAQRPYTVTGRYQGQRGPTPSLGVQG